VTSVPPTPAMALVTSEKAPPTTEVACVKIEPPTSEEIRFKESIMEVYAPGPVIKDTATLVSESKI